MESLGTRIDDAGGVDDGKRRCPRCGALNSGRAQWCGRCLDRFPDPAPLAETAVSRERPARRPEEEKAPATRRPEDLGPADGIRSGEDDGSGRLLLGPDEVVERGALVVTRAGITWRCALCDAVNPFEAGSCSVCGSSFAATLGTSDEPRVERDPGAAALLSLFLPGAGHAYLGMWSQGVARAILSAWAVTVALFGLLQEDRGAVLGVAFGIVALALWAIGAHDAYREAAGEPSAALLKPSHFVSVVLGLLVLMVVLMFATALGARA